MQQTTATAESAKQVMLISLLSVNYRRMQTFEMQSQHVHSTHSSVGVTHPSSGHAQALLAGQLDMTVQQRFGYACISSSALHAAANM